MFYDEKQAILACEHEPSLIFELIKENHIEVVDKILSRHKVDINTCDMNGNNILMYLLKKGFYDVVLKHMKDKKLDINHQNNDGDTFAHILVTINYVNVLKIIKQLTKNKDFLPNIKNMKGETILDKSINENYIFTTIKILEDKRFDNIDLLSFKNLYETYIKTNRYGKYTRLTNLEIILDNLESKDLMPSMSKLISILKENYEYIKEEVFNNKTSLIDSTIKNIMQEI